MKVKELYQILAEIIDKGEGEREIKFDCNDGINAVTPDFFAFNYKAQEFESELEGLYFLSKIDHLPNLINDFKERYSSGIEIIWEK